jgi:uncharacterized membrane protein
MAFMSGICPQRPGHSYTLGGVQLPLEARMVGMFAGFVVGAVVLSTAGRARSFGWPRGSVAIGLALGFATMAFDGTNALLFDLGLPHAYSPDLRLRLATGLLAGMAMAFFAVPALAQAQLYVDEASVHTTSPAGTPSWRDAGLTLGGIALFGLLVASGWSLLLLPVALVAAGGALLALAVVNSVVLRFLVSGRPGLGTATRLWRVDLLAVGVAASELIALALVRALFLPGFGG